VEDLIDHISQDFEEHMNDDLNVKDAFDSLYETVYRLLRLKKEGKLSDSDVERTLVELKKIDKVLQIIII
jgi:cysteinyl-tRNA synthetase